MFGWGELVVILLILLLVFGGKKLPEIAKNLGIGMKEFRKASQEISSELSMETPPPNSQEKDSPQKNEPK